MKKIHFFAAVFPLLVCSDVTANVSHATIINDHHKKGVHSHTENSFIEYLLGQNLPLKDKPEEGISQTKLIDVPLIKQYPELRYGCEVTSLAMVLNYAGVKVNKMELFRKVKKDGDPLLRSHRGDILKWGDPHEGFVGDMTGRNGKAGYAVFDQPIVQLMNEYLPDRAINLTNQPFDTVIAHISKGYPVVIWTTGDYRLPDRWESWQHGNHTIKTPLDLHVVVLVGYDSHFVYLNDPLSGRKNVKVNKKQFIESWKALKSRAVSFE